MASEWTIQECGKWLAVLGTEQADRCLFVNLDGKWAGVPRPGGQINCWAVPQRERAKVTEMCTRHNALIAEQIGKRIATQTVASATVKRAQFASRCPGCRMTIEAGSPIHYDADVRGYVSDCCA